VGFVNFMEPDAAARAQWVLHGARLADDRYLYIALQVNSELLTSCMKP
jgi:hypothetical protein